MTDKSSPASPPPTRTRYGTSHPECVDNPLWELAIREDLSGYGLRQQVPADPGRESPRQHFARSTYRDANPGPFWSWQRFGRTSTALPDGRVIHIAGEHEDSYDPDFCIYNDVVVEYAGARREFYLYPKDVFPPTDFHSATLVGDEIILIGSLGYYDLRRVSETQVLKLHTRTLRIEPVATAGEGPGWISRHTAEKFGDAAILVVGGKVQTADGYEPNRGIFELDLATMTWRRRQYADTALFPVSEAAYRQHKNPRYGTANPERSDNPFWIEMAHRRWSPSRARLHFGDFAPPQPEFVLPEDLDPDAAEPEAPQAAALVERIKTALDRTKLKRTIADVVWTAVREEPLTLTLADGRRLLIGGEVADYGEEYADPWSYNDVVVTHRDGRVEILTYPKEVFPHLHWPVGAETDKGILVLGTINRKRHPDRPRGQAVLYLDPSSYEVTELPAPPARLKAYPGCAQRDGVRVVLPMVRERDTDTELCMAFDFETQTWSEPFPRAHPAAGDDW